jgi:hypothetical protein
MSYSSINGTTCKENKHLPLGFPTSRLQPLSTAAAQQTQKAVPQNDMTMNICQGCTNPGGHIAQATIFCTVLPNIFNIICAVLPPPSSVLPAKMCSNSHAASIKCQVFDSQAIPKLQMLNTEHAHVNLPAPTTWRRRLDFVKMCGPLGLVPL